MFNAIVTDDPCVYILEKVDGYEVVEDYCNSYEVLGKFNTLFAARQFANEL